VLVPLAAVGPVAVMIDAAVAAWKDAAQSAQLLRRLEQLTHT
jgi:hypothetical protein